MVRRSIVMGALTAAIVCSVTVGSAHAQGRRGGMGMGGGFMLLRMAEVQKELKLTPEQITKVDAKADSVMQESRDAMQSAGDFRSMSPEDRQKVMDKIQAINAKATKEILDETQQKRLHQLELQQQGGNALTRKDVQDGLKLTDDQKKQIAEVQSKANDERRAMMQDAGGDFQAMREKMMAMQKATSEKMMAVLTDDQKKQWKEMLGDPFTFPTPPGR